MKRRWNRLLAGWASLGLWCVVGAVLAAATFGCARAATPTADKPPVEDPNKPETVIVARIGDYTITKAQLQQRVVQAAAPQREYEAEPNRVVTVPGVLDELLAEKALALEGRKLGLLTHKDIRPYVESTRMSSLISLMGEDYIREHMTLTDADIEAQKKTDPNLTPDQAKARAQQLKVNDLYRKFLAELVVQRKVKKATENFAKAAAAHQRLLTQPAKPRGQNVYWITGQQIEEELTPEEKGLVMATFDGGRLTLQEWFEAINEMAPPGRPRDLGTVEGVSKFTDRALEGPVLMAEAIARGYDKNKKHIDTMRTVEDNALAGKVLSDRLAKIPEPNDSEIKAYFEKNAARFGTPASLKIDQIWCRDLATAQRVKEQLAGGAAFAALKTEYSLRKEEQAHDTWQMNEGAFWGDVCKAEPNTIVGPVKGFFDPRVKWRVVQVLEKKPGKLVPYSDEVKNRVKDAVTAERYMTARRQVEKEMLAKHPHEVYAEKFKDIDPLAVSADTVPVR